MNKGEKQHERGDRGKQKGRDQEKKWIKMKVGKTREGKRERERESRRYSAEERKE